MSPIVADSIAASLAELTPETSVVAQDEFGVDVWCNGSDVRPDFGYVTGVDVLRQRIVRRLSTPRGTLREDPDFGIDLVDYANYGMTVESVLALRGAIIGELSKDETILSVQVDMQVSDAYDLTILITGSTRQGPFRLTAMLPTSGALEFIYG